MSSRKQSRKSKKKEELPSFLVGLTAPPEDIFFAPKPQPSFKYLGPIFFGECSGYPHHPPPHSLKLGSFHQPQYGMLPGHDSVSKLLYTHMKVEKDVKVMKTFTPKLKRQKVFEDTRSHRSPGVNKKFVPETHAHVVDLGKTQSIIEGEVAIEMPLCRVSSRGYKRKSGPKHNVEFTTFSDIREKNRMYMSYKERIAHAHFPKEFTTVRIIGPPIPASITITKLPSKRKARPEITLEAKPKEEEEEEAAKETEEEKGEAQERRLSASSSRAEETGKSETSDMKIKVGSSENVSERERMNEEEEKEKEDDRMEEEEREEEERQEEGGQKEEEQEREGEEGQKEEEQDREGEEGQKEEEQEEEGEEGQKEEEEEGEGEENQKEEEQKEGEQREEAQKEEEQQKEEAPKEEQEKEKGRKEKRPEEEGLKEEQSTEEGQKEEQNEEGEEEIVSYGENTENENRETEEENN